MYPVSKIDTLSSSRCLVHMEDGTAFPVYRKELSRYGIKEEMLIGEEQYRVLMEEVLPKRAKLRAMHLLQKMDRTEAQLRRKLEEAQYPSELVDLAVDYVKSYHYIDDVRYAFHYIDFRKDTQSRYVMKMNLLQKGISAEDIETAMEQIDFPDESGQIRRWMEKKQYDPAASDRKETQKLVQFLQRKGYSLSSIYAELKAFHKE